MKEHKHAAILRAIADSKEVEVEFKRLDTGEWVPMMSERYVNPVTDYHLEWRIKPEPKPPIVKEWHFIYGGHGNFFVDDHFESNIRFTFDPDTRLPIKVELI